ncbi:hypothetical protein NQ318_012398 [Aromia moschata]|uniref:Protein ARV n=1 Tax=Aromia moschata TaxID=1265417 RepID=A0AAV8Y2P3_9CUCU|nr:hypothetical protein NQ318_012398 [Aromia moschata]
MNDNGEAKEYTCIECGNNEICNNTTDKYVEYDSVIVIIDLILLRIMAYRHFLLNSDFKVDTLCFVVVIYLCTTVYTSFKNQRGISFVMVCKAVTLSSTGMFLFLPSLIWDLSVHEYHSHFISLYTTLSQLLAYKALCNCEKMWSLFVIFSSILVKTYIGNVLTATDFSLLIS